MTVLTLALILGSISVASAASGKVKLTDIADNTNEEAIQVTYDLGIVTGTPEGAYEPEKAVNRAEFAALITRALAIPESALASYSSTTFKDTSGYGWAVPYLAILQQRGIMKGDGYGNAMPGRTITPNEAVTMVLRAIGYTDNASVLVGQWPANYVALGQSQNLYAKVANDLQMNKASAAQMVYNVLTTQLVQVDANSTVKYLFDSDNVTIAEEQSLLTMNLDCKRDPRGGGKKIVQYSDAETSKINLLPNVGAYGVLYRSNADNEVVALTKVETQFLAGRLTFKTSGADAGKIDKFQAVDGTKYTLSTSSPDAENNRIAPAVWAEQFNTGNGNLTSVPSGSAIFLNGDGVASLTNAELDNYVFYNDAGILDNQAAFLIVAAKVSGQTITDLRSVAIWNADYRGDTFLYESGQIDNTRFNGHDFPLDVNNARDDYGYVLAGVDSLDDITADNVVYIYKNDAKKIARIDVGTATQSGTVTNVNTADSERTVGGQVLVVAPYSGHDKDGVDTVGNEGTALLDIYGRIYDFKLGEASKGNFAVLTGTNSSTASASGSFENLQFKLFDKAGNDTVYTMKSPFEFTDTNNYFWTAVRTYNIYRGVVPTPAKSNPLAWSPTYATGVGAPFAEGTLIEYKISGGNISEIPAVGTPVGAGLGHVNPAGSILTIKGRTGGIIIESNALVYVQDGTDYSIGSVKDLVDKDIDAAFQYITNSKGNIAALRVDTSDAGAQNVFVMINSIPEGWNNGGRADIVNGLDFTSGSNATAKPWFYTNDGLPSELGTSSRGSYSTMVKFRIGEDGILKNAGRLDSVFDDVNKDGVDNDGPGSTSTNPTITGVLFGEWNSGSGGTFQIQTTVGGVYMPIAFEANTVLYKYEGGSWVAYRPTEGNFKADAAGTTYQFLKTDLKKTYDVIIKL
jgi:hypothetical protein